MITYHRIPYKNSDGYTGYRFTKGNMLTKGSRIPPEVMEKFEINSTIEYDDKPELRRCIFCDGYQTRQKMLNLQTVELCEWHYQHMNLGKIAAQVNLLEREAVTKAAAETAAIEAKRLARAKKRKPRRKSKLSSIVN